MPVLAPTEKESRSYSKQISFYPKGLKIKLIFALRTDVFEIRASFQNFHIWACNTAFEEKSQSCICTLTLPKGSKLSLFSLYRPPFLRYWSIFITSIFGHEIRNLKKKSQSCICTLVLPPEDENELIFALRAMAIKIWQLLKYINIPNLYSAKSKMTSCPKALHIAQF